MNAPYIIFTDVSADMSPELAKEYDIHFVPMRYTLGDAERTCDCMESEDILHQFYEGQRHGDMTQTTQISPQNYMDLFTPFVQKGISILYLSLSSGLSNTYNSSLMAAEELKDQYPDAQIVCVDTLGATCGMGVLVEAAAKNREAGMNITDNAGWLEENRLKVCHWFMVEDLMYLKRGGRISPTTALAGTALNIKPILTIEADGTLKNFAKKRGSKAAMSYLVELYKASARTEAGDHVYIIHADNPDAAEYLEQAVKEFNPDAKTTKIMLSPIIGAHTGPGMCAIAHFGNENYLRK